MDKSVAIVTVGFNSSALLPELLQSIKDNSYLNLKFVYIDNGSSDDSLDIVNKSYPEAIVQANPTNLGFAKGNNQGIKIAIDNKADFIFLLNHDVVLDKDCILKLVNQSSQDTISQPLILIHKEGIKTDLINTTGTYLNFLGFSYCSQYLHKRSDITSYQKDILGASGAAMFIPTPIVQKIGLLDENYFMYFEDLDLCWRARAAGFKINLIHDSVVWHKYRFKSSPNRWFYSETSRLYFLFKNFQAITILKILPLYLINELLSLAYSIYGNFFFQKIRSYLRFVQLLPSIISYRHLQTKNRVINDSEFKPFIKSELSFKEINIPFINLYNKVTDLYYKNIYLKT